MFTNDACQLTYRVFHLYFTIPPTIVLALLARPFLTQLERLKLILLPLVAFVWTTAWDSELIRMRAWGYPRACVLGTVWRTPVEEYFFFLIQSVMSTLFTTLLTRWILPPLYLQPQATRSSVLRAGTLMPISYAALCLSGLALAYRSEDQHNYYLGMILWWSSVPLMLLTWGAADYMAAVCSPTVLEGARGAYRPALGRAAAVFASVAVPTGYLWFADVFALRRGTWFISRHTSLEIFVIPDLPIEEATFFFVTNLILVVASFAFDRCVAVARFYPAYLQSSESTRGVQGLAPLSPVRLPLNLSTIRTMWAAFITSMDSSASPSKSRSADTLAAHLAILSSASRSFSLASLLMPWDLRADLGSVYAFCRASDNLIDDAGPPTTSTSTSTAADKIADDVMAAARKEKRLGLLRQVVLLACGNASPAAKKEAETGHAGMDTETRKQLIAMRIQSFARAELLPENNAARFALAPQQQADALGNAATALDPLQDVGTAASILVDMRGLISRGLWNELLDGYVIDLGMDAVGLSPLDIVAQPSSDFNLLPPAAAKMETLDDLGEYAQCVAGAVGEMCVRVVLGRVGRPMPEENVGQRETLTEMLLAIGRHPSKTLSTAERKQVEERERSLSLEERLLLNARRMGVALQLINIARDVVSDSRALQRSYLPRELFDERDAWVSDALRSGLVETPASFLSLTTSSSSSRRRSSSKGSLRPPAPAPAAAEIGSPPLVRIEREVSPALVRTYRQKILDIAQALYDASFPVLAELPCPPARAGLRVACAVYADIARATLGQSDVHIREGRRARSGTWRRVFVAVRALYL
ncbi:unnamed protein product [Tilletia controversa]|uniref:Bifunctional lycopene cyclase/phytoene synthase n=1 Tax=Tilletia controversa TaxID=13291 RepID=A0A8X7MWW4_9BASI|nr:hypothetical protein CF328_g5109 [Tilletia controversa]KAE8250955.1 hypothetical protein A4X06_0g2875 [Tilletia controversa]CAD6967149.1 unnamed protein product [Tilletia controversa]